MKRTTGWRTGGWGSPWEHPGTEIPELERLLDEELPDDTRGEGEGGEA
jgi:hypothetical protein